MNREQEVRFYNLCQGYRHTPIEDQAGAVEAFNELKAWVLNFIADAIDPRSRTPEETLRAHQGYWTENPIGHVCEADRNNCEICTTLKRTPAETELECGCEFNFHGTGPSETLTCPHGVTRTLQQCITVKTLKHKGDAE